MLREREYFAGPAGNVSEMVAVQIRKSIFCRQDLGHELLWRSVICRVCTGNISQGFPVGGYADVA